MVGTLQYVKRGTVRYAKRAIGLYRRFLYWRSNERRVRTYSREHIRVLQWQKLKDILEYAYHKVPIYRERFREAGVAPDRIRKPEDLLRIPVLTKDDIRRNFPDRLLNPDRKHRPSRMGQTSGSTAESMHFVRPDQTWCRELYNCVFLRTGRITNLPILVLATPHCTAATCGLEEDQNAQEAWVGRAYALPPLRHLEEMIALPSHSNILSAPPEYMERLAKTLSRFSPCIVIADPVYLASFARYLGRNPRPGIQVRHLITTYELLTGSLKDLFRRTFGCEPYTEYGGSEVLDVANECEYHRLHVMPDNVWVEAIRGGESARPGEVARAVVTDLGNFNMPFIRYDIGDLIAMGDGACPCGRNTDTIACVHGRVGDVIAANGPNETRLVTPLQADDIFRGVRGVAFYRLVQVSLDSYQIAIMPDDPSGAVDTELVAKRCRSMLGQNSRVAIDLVKEIEPERSMKFRFVYSGMSPPPL